MASWKCHIYDYAEGQCKEGTTLRLPFCETKAVALLRPSSTVKQQLPFSRCSELGGRDLTCELCNLKTTLPIQSVYDSGFVTLNKKKCGFVLYDSMQASRKMMTKEGHL
jgi:hypothetical protein